LKAEVGGQPYSLAAAIAKELRHSDLHLRLIVCLDTEVYTSAVLRLARTSSRAGIFTAIAVSADANCLFVMWSGPNSPLRRSLRRHVGGGLGCAGRYASQVVPLVGT